LVVVAVTAIPYVYAYHFSPPDRQFMGVMVNIPDHFQYFSWLREAHTQILVPNQLTPEYSTPLLFNFLWWSLGQIQVLTGISYDGLYQITRWLAGIFVIMATYFFAGVIFTQRAKRWMGMLVGVFAGGVGYIWVIEKYLTGEEMSLTKSFDLFTSEPNTFFNILAFPHFSIAAGLIAVVFGIVLVGWRSQKLFYAIPAALVALLLSMQHAYDMFIIYPVIGFFGLAVWIRDRKFPMYLLKLGLIVVLVSMWPALQAYTITSTDEVWREVLAQFGNAGAYTPSPLHIPILMGIGWLIAIWALDFRVIWKGRDDTQLFVTAWFLSHFILIYLPFDFQIHLLSGWQIPIGILVTIGITRRIVPFLRRFFKNASSQQLTRWASIGVLVLVIPVNLYLYAWRFIDLRRADYPYFTHTSDIAAFDYLESQVASDDVVLASLTIGQYVPAMTGARSFLAHWAQTLDFYGKSEMVKTFFNAATDDADRLAILDEFSVDYVYYSPNERALNENSFDPADADYLESVFTDGEVTVYAVTRTN
jgi:hypothetical protein